MWWRSEPDARRVAVEAFRAKYPGGLAHHVETVAEDDGSCVVQVLHGLAACRMASFWVVSKTDSTVRELHASDLGDFLDQADRPADEHQHCAPS